MKKSFFIFCPLFFVAIFFQNCSEGIDGGFQPTENSLEEASPETPENGVREPSNAGIDLDNPKEEVLDESVKVNKVAVQSSTELTFAQQEIVLLEKRLNRYMTKMDKKTSFAYWGVADILRTATELHKLTEDRSVLIFLLEAGETLLQRTGKKLKIKEYLQGKLLDIWVTGNYSCGKISGHLVHNMILIDNIAYGLRELVRDKELTASERRRLKAVTKRFEKIFTYFKRNYVKSKRIYTFPKTDVKLKKCKMKDFAARAGKPLPMNMNLAAGLAHFNMYRLHSALGNISKKNAHKKMFGGLSSYLKKSWKTEKNGKSTYYTWKYVENGRIEDTSHAYLTLRYVTALSDQGWTFSSTHLKRLAKTFHFLYRNGKKVRSHLSKTYGRVAADRDNLRALTRYVSLCRRDKTVLRKVKNLIARMGEKNVPRYSLIKLKRYSSLCK